MGFPGGASGKEPACQCRRCKRFVFDPWVRNIPWNRKEQPTPVFLPGEPHRQRSLVGYSPQGCKEWDMTERLSTAHHTPEPAEWGFLGWQNSVCFTSSLAGFWLEPKWNALVVPIFLLVPCLTFSTYILPRLARAGSQNPPLTSQFYFSL